MIGEDSELPFHQWPLYTLLPSVSRSPKRDHRIHCEPLPSLDSGMNGGQSSSLGRGLRSTRSSLYDVPFAVGRPFYAVGAALRFRI
ncbi:hypothetical protein BHM03_00006593 [Ensete ventricosum]|nr:hypothetical protein BHM03_00006593 [Ensete ventricosum]